MRGFLYEYFLLNHAILNDIFFEMRIASCVRWGGCCLPMTAVMGTGRVDGAFFRNLEQINFEMLHISKLSFCRKMRFSAESTPRCGALHSGAASRAFEFFQS